jgi:hypothetical protein
MHLFAAILIALSTVDGLRRASSRYDDERALNMPTRTVAIDDGKHNEIIPSPGDIVDNDDMDTSKFNKTFWNHNVTSEDDIAWGQGALSNKTADSGKYSDSLSKNVTMTDKDNVTREIGTSAFLFVSIPIIALVAAVASKYGKSPNENSVSRTPRDTDDNSSSHRMITTASEEDHDGSGSGTYDDRLEQDDRDIDDGTEEAFGNIPVDRKLFVQVYKPHRDQTELTAIKHGLAMALHDRGDWDRSGNSPILRGAGRYNLAGRHSYTPDNDSEHNSPFDEPSIPI